MNQALLFFHLFGLMLGAAGGMSSGIIMRRAASATPEAARTLRELGPMLARVSAAGVGLLWVTGLVLVWSRWGGPGNLPPLFWVKLVFVLTLTATVAGTGMAYAAVRGGNPAAAARLSKLGPISGISAILAVLFAVCAFSS
jgi:uncharacterized membrane protein